MLWEPYIKSMFLWKTVFLVSLLFLSFSSSLFMSCLMFIMSSVLVSVSFMSMGLNWLMYTMIILYLGGMMVLFMYMCSISSVSKIETTSLIPLLMIMFLTLAIYMIFPKFYFLVEFSGLKTFYSLYSTGSQGVLVMLGVYLILGLLASIFFMEKLQGPLKSFYAK